MRLVYLASHPIQYHSPLFRALARQCDFEAWFAHRQDAAGQSAAGYGTAFEWDVELLGGYRHRFLHNVAGKPSVGRFNGCNTPEVADWLTQTRPQALVVGGWNLRSYWQAIAAAKRLRIPVFARSDSQSQPGDGRWRRLLRQIVHRPLLRSLDGFLAAGVHANAYLRTLGVPSRRIHVVPHTVDVARFAAGVPLRAATREALDAGERLAVLFVGRLVLGKRVDMLIEAVRGLSRHNVVLWIVGDGPQRAVLQAQAAKAGIAVGFLGFRNQTELPALYAAADLLVLPSDSETWGLVVNEALAAGCNALVSPAVGCGPDLSAFGPAVLVCGPGVEGLRSGLCDMLSGADPAARSVARAAAVAAFAPDEAARRLLCAVGCDVAAKP